MPFWIMTALICYANYQSFAEVQRVAAEKDPMTFGTAEQKEKHQKGTNQPDVEMGKTAYGATGQAGGASAPKKDGSKNESSTNPPPVLTEEEREELKAQVMASSSRLCSKCCSQCFLLMIVALFVAKLQGAGFLSLWIMSPFLIVAGLILCCVGFAIFGITEVPTDGVEFDTGDFSYSQAETGGYTQQSAPPPSQANAPSTSANYVPPPPMPSEAAVPPPSQTSTPVQVSTTDSATTGGGAAIPKPAAASVSSPATGPIDLLDDAPTNPATSKSGEFNDLD